MLPLRPSWAVPPCAQFPLVLEDGAGPLTSSKPLIMTRLVSNWFGGLRTGAGYRFGCRQALKGVPDGGLASPAGYSTPTSPNLKLARDRVPSRSFLGGTSEGKSLDERRCEGGKRADRDGGSPVAGL